MTREGPQKKEEPPVGRGRPKYQLASQDYHFPPQRQAGEDLTTRRFVRLSLALSVSDWIQLRRRVAQ
jgi:hypothetical protein